MKRSLGNSLEVQWLGLSTFSAGSLDSIPGWGTRIPQTPRGVIREKKKEDKAKKIKATFVFISLSLVHVNAPSLKSQKLMPTKKKKEWVA